MTTIQRDYERSMRRLRESVYRMEQLGYVLPRCIKLVLARVRIPEQVTSRKYLVMLMLFSQTCETLGAALTMREQLVVSLTNLSRRHPTPDIQRKIKKLDKLVLSQNRNIQNHRMLLGYRSDVLLDILDGKEPSSRYT